MYEFSDSKTIPTLYSQQMIAKIHRRKHWIVFITEKKNSQYYQHSNKQQSYATVAIRYCIFNQPTIVQIVFPNTDHSLFISNQLQIALKLLFIVQCNFVVKTVRTLNKLRSSKVVLSGYFREFLHAGSGKYVGETGTLREKLNFHKFTQDK